MDQVPRDAGGHSLGAQNDKGREMATIRTKQVSVVTMSTLSFTVCFAVWMMFAVIGIPIKKMLSDSRPGPRTRCSSGCSISK